MRGCPIASAPRVGRYVGDTALAERICELLHEASQDCVAKPLFVFAITMENHAPDPLSELDREGARRFFVGPHPNEDSLSAYLKHLEQADKALGMLRQKIEALPEGGALCVYGDHVPILPAVYRRFGEPDGRTDYLVWTHGKAATGPVCANSCAKIGVESLGRLLLKETGLAD